MREEARLPTYIPPVCTQDLTPKEALPHATAGDTLEGTLFPSVIIGPGQAQLLGVNRSGVMW